MPPGAHGGGGGGTAGEGGAGAHSGHDPALVCSGGEGEWTRHKQEEDREKEGEKVVEGTMSVEEQENREGTVNIDSTRDAMPLFSIFSFILFRSR